MLREYEDKSGKPYLKQWVVLISEGKAKAFTKGVGYESSTYKEVSRLYVRIGHKEMFDMITSSVIALNLWEYVNGSKLFRDRERELEKLELERESA